MFVKEMVTFQDQFIRKDGVGGLNIKALRREKARTPLHKNRLILRQGDGDHFRNEWVAALSGDNRQFGKVLGRHLVNSVPRGIGPKWPQGT